jgi:hypothetical protein
MQKSAAKRGAHRAISLAYHGLASEARSTTGALVAFGGHGYAGVKTAAPSNLPLRTASRASFA